MSVVEIYWGSLGKITLLIFLLKIYHVLYFITPRISDICDYEHIASNKDTDPDYVRERDKDNK